MVLKFIDAVSPISLDEFKNFFLDSKFCYIEGKDSSRFEYLMPWSKFNELLSSYRLSYPRLRLWKEGAIIPENKYTVMSKVRREEAIKTIIPELLTKEIEDGASIIINSVNETHRPLQELTEEIQIFFKTVIKVNLYASWKAISAFIPHWDDHDVIILQVHGSKKWFVYEDNFKYPLPSQLVEHKNALPDKIYWQGILKPGDVIFVPRGWWHYGIAQNNQSLHLTFGLTNSTGVDFMTWLVNHFSKYEFFRRNIPKLEEKAVLNNYIEEFIKEMQKSLSYQELTEFLDYEQNQIKTHFKFSFPYALDKTVTDK